MSTEVQARMIDGQGRRIRELERNAREDLRTILACRADLEDQAERFAASKELSLAKDGKLVEMALELARAEELLKAAHEKIDALIADKHTLREIRQNDTNTPHG